MLDTGSTINLLNKDLENGCNDHRILTSFDDNLSLLNPENKDLLVYNHEDIHEFPSFKIGGEEFGPLIYHQVKCPFDVDVILGMDFFAYNLVFFDFENEKVYFFPYPEEEKEKLKEDIEGTLEMY